MLIESVCSKVYAVFEDVGFADAIPIRQMKKDVSNYVSLSFKEFLARKVSESGSSTAISCPQGAYTWLDIEKGAQLISLSRMVCRALGAGNGQQKKVRKTEKQKNRQKKPEP